MLFPSRRKAEPAAENEETRTPPPPAGTLLPAPIASLVSLATATSSLSLRVGGFVGHLAVNATRVGALSGVELSRAILESVLFRAGQDVVESSTGELGRAAAESILESTLSMIHNTLTQTSFLISAGFRIGSSSLSAGLGLSHALCTAIDAVLGDTETSKAIATIVVMMQREFKNPTTTSVQRVNMLDVLSGSITFVLLQRWSWDKTDSQFKDEDVIEAVWDIVVVDASDPLEQNALSLYDTQSSQNQPIAIPENPDRALLTRASSFISTGVDEETLDNTFLDDGASFNSLASAKRLGNTEVARPEQVFRQQLSDQLNPGSSVKVAAQSVLRNTVIVEVQGDEAPSEIEPPAGYTLVAVQNVGFDRAWRRKFIFQSVKKRSRRGSFEVSPRTPFIPSTPMSLDNSPFEFPESSKDFMQTEIGGPSQDVDELKPSLSSAPLTRSVDLPIRANDKRPRSSKTPLDFKTHQTPSFSFPRQTEEDEGEAPPTAEKNSVKSSIKNSLKRGTPYSKLMDFWTHGQSTRNGTNRGHDRTVVGARGAHVWDPSTTRSSSPDAARHSISRADSYTSMDLRPSVDLEQRPGSRESYRTKSIHRRGGSSIYNLQINGSDTSLVLHSDSRQATRDRLAQSLSSSGRLAGQYPVAPFAHNIARFVRFSVAAYGSSFLRFMGAAVDQRPRLVEEDSDHHLEHRSFSQYAGLPSSTILLSSFVDPEGGANMNGSLEGALPLIHFISVDHESRAIVLTCRGTLGFEDVLTDMTCDYDELHWRGKTYLVHKGMLASARRLITIHGGRLIVTLKAALEEFDGYGLILCGHSLGGGVAAVLGILMAQPNPFEHGDASAFVTASPLNQPPRPEGAPYPHPADSLAMTLPSGRPVHVYAFGPAATMSSSLATATRGLVTSIINNGDIVPYLCLGNLRDFQAIALAFKTDGKDAKAEVRRRVWEGLKKALTYRTGFGAGESFFARDWQRDEQMQGTDDEWPWIALQDLRARMVADKLVPPGECFLVERRAVLQRLAFTDAAGKEAAEYDGTKRSTKSFRPASHIRVTHVKDLALRFAEIRFQGSMFLDHLPARYEKILETLEVGIA